MADFPKFFSDFFQNLVFFDGKLVGKVGCDQLCVTTMECLLSNGTNQFSNLMEKSSFRHRNRKLVFFDFFKSRFSGDFLMQNDKAGRAEHKVAHMLRVDVTKIKSYCRFSAGTTNSVVNL